MSDAGRVAVVQFWDSVGRAGALRRSGRFAEAARAYEEALRHDDGHEESLYYLGQCRRETGDAAGAGQAFTRLLEVNPGSARGHLALAALLASPDHQRTLDLQGAEAHLRRAHEINAEETGPMLRLGEVLIVQGRLEEARRWLEAAGNTNPKSVEAAFLTGYLLWERGDRHAAAAYLDRAVRARQPDAPIRGVLGEGDRRASDSRSGPAPPPLREPMGRTLFSAFAERLGGAEPVSLDEGADEFYRAVRQARRSMAARVVASSTP